MQAARIDRFEIIDLRAVADHQFKRAIDLGNAAIMAFGDQRLGALFNHDQRAGEAGARRVATGSEHQMDRTLQFGTGGDLDNGAIAHQRGVERDRGVVGLEDLADMLGDQRIALRQSFRHRA